MNILFNKIFIAMQKDTFNISITIIEGIYAILYYDFVTVPLNFFSAAANAIAASE